MDYLGVPLFSETSKNVGHFFDILSDMFSGFLSGASSEEGHDIYILTA